MIVDLIHVLTSVLIRDGQPLSHHSTRWLHRKPRFHSPSCPSGQEAQDGRGGGEGTADAADGVEEQPGQEGRAAPDAVAVRAGDDSADQHAREDGGRDGGAPAGVVALGGRGGRPVPQQYLLDEERVAQNVIQAADLGGVAGVGDAEGEEEEPVAPPVGINTAAAAGAAVLVRGVVEVVDGAGRPGRGGAGGGGGVIVGITASGLGVPHLSLSLCFLP